MMAELSLEGIKKLPPWAWVVGVAGAGLVYVLYIRQNTATTSSASTAPASPVPNTQTPSGPCPTYTTPTCQNGEVLAFQTDQNGCPIPVCAPPGAASGAHCTPDNYVTTNGSTTFYSASQVFKDWGWQTIKFYNSIHGEPQLAGYGEDTRLPAGLQLKVGGCFP